MRKYLTNILAQVYNAFVAREGKDEIEAYRNLMEVLGIEYPLNKEKN